MWTIFKVFICYNIASAFALFCFFFFFWPWGMWDLSCPTRDRTYTSCTGKRAASPLDRQGSSRRLPWVM